MRKIGITQRVEVVPEYGERRDCLDQQWYSLLQAVSLLPVPIPNNLENPVEWFRLMQLDGLILSGGNDPASLPDADRPAPERDRSEAELLDYACENSVPVLGVCRGMQVLNLHLGGKLDKVQGHVAEPHQVCLLEASELFDSSLIVNSFHKWGIVPSGLAKPLIAHLTGPDKCIEAVSHPDRPLVGIMWHPERETSFKDVDLKLIQDLFRGVS